MADSPDGEGRARRGFRLAAESLRLLGADPELIALALFGVVAFIAISFGLFVAVFGHVPVTQDFRGGRYFLVFPIFAVGSIVPLFTNAAIVGAATIRLQGGEPTLRDGLRLARAKFPKLVCWWLVSVTVGFFLHAVLARLRLAGRLASLTFGVTWSLATVFVIPTLLYEPVGALDAVRRSASLFKQRWGEEVAGTGSIGLAVSLVMLPVMVLCFVAAAAAGVPPKYFFVLWMVVLSAVMVPVSALGSVFNAALYRYAVSGEALGPFSESDLGHAYKYKPKHGNLFSRKR
jgi:hypothetical protein